MKEDIKTLNESIDQSLEAIIWGMVVQWGMLASCFFGPGVRVLVRPE